MTTHTDTPHRIDVIDGLYAEGLSSASTSDTRYADGVYGWFCIEGDDLEHLHAELLALGFSPEDIARAPKD